MLQSAKQMDAELRGERDDEGAPEREVSSELP